MIRLGCATIAAKYGPSGLIGQADAIADLGFETIKLELSGSYATKYPGTTWDTTHTTLASLAADSNVDAVFSDSRFNRFFLNTFTLVNGINNDWVNDAPPAMIAAEKAELKAFANVLFARNDGNEYVIQNWEGDWMLLASFDPYASPTPRRCARMASFYRARQEAIDEARSENPTSTTKVIHAMEVNRVLDNLGARCHSDVIPLVHPDAISFSLYECMNTFGVNQAATEANIVARMTTAVRRVRDALNSRVKGSGDSMRLYIGEFGYNEFEADFTFHGIDAGDLIQVIVDTADSLGMSDAVFWQCYDNEEQSPGVPRGFAIYDTLNVLTEQGTKLVSLL